jgi:heterodisulfide reductase subunit A-like polyferredoxin
MSNVTLNESGKILTETLEGVTVPFDYSFSNVNDFVHSTETQYEDLECLCLGMASHIEKLQKALEDIKKHQVVVGGDIAEKGATWNIANNALVID